MKRKTFKILLIIGFIVSCSVIVKSVVSVYIYQPTMLQILGSGMLIVWYLCLIVYGFWLWKNYDKVSK